MDLQEVKRFLRVDYDDDDELISSLINSAEEYIRSACGIGVNLQSERARTVERMLISDWYESRSPYGQGKYSQSITTMLVQLQLETSSMDGDS